MLLLRFCEVDRLAGDKGQLAVDDAGTDGASNRNEHDEK